MEDSNSSSIKIPDLDLIGWSSDGYKPFYDFEFERLDINYWHKFVSLNWQLPFYTGAVYIALIFSVQKHMKSRSAFKLQRPLFLWNLSLGIFSIFGFFRMAPGIMYAIVQPNGFYGSICHKRFVDLSSIYWWMLFVISKYIELGDTLFIVLRKRPLIFLQWYHHLVTMIVVWIAAPFTEPATRYFCVLNYFVHSLMYPYFAARALGFRLPTTVANIITTFQFAQMIAGFAVNSISIYYYYFADCNRDPMSIKAFCLVYGSFLLLFGNLFYNMVVQRGREKKEKTHKKSL